MTLRPFAIGAAIGLPIALAAYAAIPAYANYINWQFQHPVMLIPAFFAGVALAVLTD